MKNYLNKYFTRILLILFILLFGIIWLFPSIIVLALIAFLALGFAVNVLFIVEKHKEAYLLKRILYIDYVWRSWFSTTNVMLITILAGLCGKCIGEIVAKQAGNEPAKFAVSICAGLLTGIVISSLSRKIQKHLLLIDLTMPFRK